MTGVQTCALPICLLLGLLLGVLIAPTRAESLRSRWAAVLGRSVRGEQLYTFLIALGLVMIFLNWYSFALMRTTLPF